MSTIAFDMDGVLADWCTGFTTLAARLHPGAGIEIISHNQLEHWDKISNLTDTQLKNTWDFLCSNGNDFWYFLNSLVASDVFRAIERLERSGNIIYFVTNRRGLGAYYQTKTWVATYCVGMTPSVIMTHRKGEFCKVAGVDYYIDDKSENCDCAAWLTDGKTKAYVLTLPCNSGALAPHSSKVGRVDTVAEFIDIIKNAQ